MSGRVSKDRYEKRLRVGIRFDGANFVLLDGKPLPALAKDTVAELVLAPDCILDEIVRSRFMAERSIRFLERGTPIMIGVSPTMIERGDVKALIRTSDLGILSPYLFVEVRLEADLSLRVRGDQEAWLSPCACIIPALQKQAESLNQAFTLISEAFETKRRSHSGNIFERAFAMSDPREWKNFDELRIVAIQKALLTTEQQELFPKGPDS